MEAPPKQPAIPGFDRNVAHSLWLRLLPQTVREELLRPSDLARLLGRAERYITLGATDALSDLRSEAYRLAGLLQAKVGHDSTLRYLRDGLRQALQPIVIGSAGQAEAAMEVLAAVSDSVWEAYADAIQENQFRQRGEPGRQELLLAKRIQERLLPRSIPTIPGYDIAGKVLPAAEVGGDYWSCRSYPEDDIVTIKLADVTGHGIAAATLVAAVKFISGGYYRGAKTAAQVMERTNHVLVRDTPAEILVPMVYGWLYPHSHEMSIVNAGHSPVLMYQAATDTFRKIPPTGVALGMVETRYREARLEFGLGDIFFTCSDGVTEPSGDISLGEEWVKDQVRAGAGDSAPALVERVLAEALKTYKAPIDDMSVVVIKRSA